ncbi:Aurofusarin cluster transcription factor aurR2 [Colletotrichum shisoi]|uniref:Aurofusarin cluster transcription factor aurR2 n=1 Tax=Colletotrichum shisoi TaxID=2078593 RepID=A0A5Q4BHQ7_9PEZI|nr:Aurofusarin cluster transcription factor aurR2 [Colletotrichum shisoi]
MSSNLLNFNKPCNGCRRRKVRCDKAKPCLNCVRHGIACVYDPQREPGLPTPESQQQLQERVDRLERLVEEMKGISMRSEPPPPPPPPPLKGTGSGGSFPSASPATSYYGEFNNEEVMAGDPGMQVYDDNVSYHLGPNYWLNLQDIVFEPRSLFRIDSDKTGKTPSSPSSWPIGRTPTLADLSHLHLEPEKEDVLTDLFFAHVEPFVRITHDTYWRQQITDFRVGVQKNPVDAEAAMFATQAMTVAALPGNVVQEKLGKPKEDLLRHLQEASQLALERADILRSRKPLAFFALLYYIQMKFITGDGEVAVILLGLAGRFGARLGLHRDPSHYSYSPWTANMRRRIWCHFELMDNPLYNLEGAESGLPFISDVQPPKNANDSQWMPTRFAKPNSAPHDQDGITDMSFALVRQHVVRTMQSVVRSRNDAGPDELSRIVDQTENFINAKFVSHADGSSPGHALVISYFRGSMRTIRLLIEFYQECVEILEEMERGEAVATQNDWGWLYRWPTTPCLISNVLIGLARQPKHPITDRAWRQMNIVFRRRNNEDISMRKFAAWRVVEALCDQAMLYHKQRSHEGAWYAQRLGQAQGLAAAAAAAASAQGNSAPVSLENATVDDILGDVQMFGQDAAAQHGGMGGAAFFAMGYSHWNQPAHSHPHGQGQQQPHPDQASDDGEDI